MNEPIDTAEKFVPVSSSVDGFEWRWTRALLLWTGLTVGFALGCLLGIFFGGERDGDQLDGVVLMMSDSGELLQSVKSKTKIQLAGNMLAFRDHRGRRVFIHGNTIQVER